MKLIQKLGPKQMEEYDRLLIWNEEHGMLNYPEERLEWVEINKQIVYAANKLIKKTDEALLAIDKQDAKDESLEEKLGPYNENLSGKKVSNFKINRLSFITLGLFRDGKLKKSLAEFEKVLHYYPQHKEALKYQKEIQKLLEYENDK